MRGKIWPSGPGGRNYVTALPTAWVDNYKKMYDLEVEKISIGEKIVITPPYDPSKKLLFRSRVDLSDKASLKMNITSAYLAGYDEVNVPVQKSPSKETLQLLESFIPESRAQLSYDGKKYRVTFSDTMYNLGVHDIFDQVKGTFDELHGIVAKSLDSFPQKTTIEECKKCAHLHERNLDTIAFSINRYLNKALSYGELYEKMGLNDNEIIQMTLTFNALERLADIHYEITERASRLLEREEARRTKLKVFSNYYRDAYAVLVTSLEANDDPIKGLPIIKAKLSEPEWSDYKNGILKEDEEEIKKTMTKMKDNLTVRDYTILEGKIGAILGISSNICEFAWNRNRELADQVSDKEITTQTTAV